MTTDIDAVALERAARALGEALLAPADRTPGKIDPLGAITPAARACVNAYLAALASAQPAQAGEYEGLAKRLEALRIMDEVGSDNPLGRQAASAIRTLEAERDEARRLSDEHDKDATDMMWQRRRADERAEAAEARALAAEQRLATCTEALGWYGDQFCEHSRDFEGCGKLPTDDCAGCKARAALSEASHEQR